MQTRLPHWMLVSLRGSIPKEFARKPRSLRRVDRWKATEFRQFLLFTGLVALRGKLSHDMYINFLLFHVGIFILVNRSLCLQYCDFADELLVLFVTHFAQLYGSNMLVYNVHGLVHLADEVRRFACLDNESSFLFENLLQILKKMIRKPNFPLQQVVKRLSEIGGRQFYNAAVKVEPVLTREHRDGPVPDRFQSAKQHKELHIRDVVISTCQNSYCTVRIVDDIVMVRNILHDHGDIYFVIEHFCSVTDLYTYPVASSRLGIYAVSVLSGHLDIVLAREFSNKYVLLPHRDTYAAFPLQ